MNRKTLHGCSFSTWLIILFFLSFKVVGQKPQNGSYYLANKEVSKAAKDYYSNKFKAGDDERTHSIIDSIKTSNDHTRPFYLLLVTRMMAKSDGALSEALGVACKEFVEMNPDQALVFLNAREGIAPPRYMEEWAKTIAGEFMISCEAEVKDCLKASLQKTTRKCKPENKKELAELYRKIEGNFWPG